MNDIVQAAITTVETSLNAFCKFISANDAGKTGAHQAGFYMPKSAVSLMFDSPGIKGSNKDKFIKIDWYDYKTTSSRFIYYGTGTRNEYRLTRFEKGFPFLTEDNVGDLFILAHIEEHHYSAFVLRSEEDIEDFFVAFNLSADKTNALIDRTETISTNDILLKCFSDHIKTSRGLYSSLDSESNIRFPETKELALQARNCFINVFRRSDKNILGNPDNELLKWINAEFELFKLYEIDRYSHLIKSPFSSIEELIRVSNSILNRRKSRAGKSLEHHLSALFKVFNLKFEEQIVTEENKSPDFIFPNAASYHSPRFDSGRLIMLASKTTCKDRWRQIINEADRIPEKHLFTLQQGISSNQLSEMYRYGIRLVVPQAYINTFPEEFRPKILTLKSFVQFVKEKQL